MNLSDEASEYWRLCKSYRESLTPISKNFHASILIPTLNLRANNPRIKAQLSTILNIEGIENGKDQSDNASL